MAQKTEENEGSWASQRPAKGCRGSRYRLERSSSQSQVSEPNDGRKGQSVYRQTFLQLPTVAGTGFQRAVTVKLRLRF